MQAEHTYQNTFDEIILEAERNRNPVGGLPLSRLISNSYGIYLFQQAISYFTYTYSVIYPQLFNLAGTWRLKIHNLSMWLKTSSNTLSFTILQGNAACSTAKSNGEGSE